MGVQSLTAYGGNIHPAPSPVLPSPPLAPPLLPQGDPESPGFVAASNSNYSHFGTACSFT